jgi:hypothetical protein
MKFPSKQYVILGKSYLWGWSEISRTWTYAGAIRFIGKRVGKLKYAAREYKVQRNGNTIFRVKWDTVTKK